MNRSYSHSRSLLYLALAGLCTVWLSEASPAGASLIPAVDGGISVTVDTTAGLEWVDASNTLGKVVSTALADFPGFQLATQSQVETLTQDAGFPAAQLPDGSTSDTTSGNLLASTLGYSSDYWVQFYGAGAAGWEYQSFAYYLDGAGTGVDQVDFDVRNPPLGSDGTYVNFYPLGDSFGTGSSNNFVMLVKAVPEPASVVLLATAFVAAGLGAALKRRKPY